MWTSKIFTIVYSRIVANGKIRLQTKYPNIKFVDSTPQFESTPQSTTKKFPTVIISELTSAERGKTLEGNVVKATTSDIQIDVITNTNQNDANYVADVCYDLISQMCYTATMRPLANSTEQGEYRTIARYQRTIADEDIL